MEYEDLQRLEEAQGESFYLIDSALFRDNLREMREAFRAYYPEANIAYSFKTNYIPALCRIVKEEGAYAEVVSEMECELAGKMGFAAGDIYYNGPYKKRAYVMEMLRRGVRINLDNYQEFEMALEAAEGQPVQVGLRCNFDIGSGKISRFGFDVEGEEFRRVIARIKSEKNLSLIGLHCHFPDRRLEWYANRVEQMKRVLDSLGDAALKYISFGGGYFGRIPAAFQKAFAAPVPSYEDYAQVIAKEMDSYFSGGGSFPKPELLIEPGSALVAETMDFVTKVVALKEVQGRAVAVLSGSCYNVNPSVRGMNRPISVYRKEECGGEEKSWDMVGYTCIEDDVMYRGYCGKLQAGDYVVFHNVGSYSVVFKPPFILPNVPVLDVAGEEVRILKRQEGFNDIFATYTF